MRILIVEDLPPIAEGIARAVRSILGSEIQRLDLARDIASARQHLGRRPVDLLLLDPNLRGRDGFEILRRATSGSFDTVVLSANSQRALEAFDYGALDFVRMPIERQRLRLALDRARDRNAAQSSPARRALRLWVRRRSGLVSVPVAEIRYVRGAGKYAELFLAAGQRMLHERRLKHLEADLPEHLARVHRSYIANLLLVRELRVERGGRYTLVLQGGDEIPVSRSRIEDLRRRLYGAPARFRPSGCSADL